MQPNLKIVQSVETKKKAISLTTYRAFFIAKLLFIEPMSYEGIAQALAQDTILQKSCHKDTISNSINSLREAGFEIEKPKPSNNFKFHLVSHPFKFNISKDEIMLLNMIRKSLYYQNNYELIFDINTIYEKFKSLANINEHIDLLENTNYLKNVNKKILEEIVKLCTTNADAQIVYNSPIYGNETFRIKSGKIVFENNRLYLWGYTYKYEMPAYLRIDKISAVKKEDKTTKEDISLNNYVEYELTGNAAKNFIPKEDESIIEKTKNKIKIRANVVNKFHFNQRILAFAEECKILSPQWAIDKFIEHLDEIIKVYENEK